MKSIASLTILFCVCITTPALAGLVAAGNTHTGYADSIVLTEFSCRYWPNRRGSAGLVYHSGARGSGSQAGGGSGAGGAGGGFSSGSTQNMNAAVSDAPVSSAASGVEGGVAHPASLNPASLNKDDQMLTRPSAAASQPPPAPFTPGIDDQITRRFTPEVEDRIPRPFQPGIDDQIRVPTRLQGAGAPSDDPLAGSFPLVGGPTTQEIVKDIATDPTTIDISPERPGTPGLRELSTTVQPVPEPGTVSLLVLGLIAMGARRLV